MIDQEREVKYLLKKSREENESRFKKKFTEDSQKQESILLRYVKVLIFLIIL